MCGRVVADLNQKQWALLGVPDPNLPARYNATRGATLGLIVNQQGRRVVQPGRWGLVPPGMTRADADRLALFNARIEGVSSKPSFRRAWKDGRALLAVRGWIEWRPGERGGRKQPYLIRRTDDKPVVLAALTTLHENTLTFAALTTQAPAELAWLHSRMPIALPSSEWDAWISGELQKPSPLPCRVYEVVPLDTAINDARQDHPGVLQESGPIIRGAA